MTIMGRTNPEELKPIDIVLIGACLLFFTFAALQVVISLQGIREELKQIRTTYQSTLK